MNTKIVCLLLALLIVPTIVLAASAPLDTTISSRDQAQFDAILQPVMKIYNFIKYVASVVAAIFLLFAGITYMASGNDVRKREQAKNTGAYVIIGLIIIWAAPFIIGLLV